MRKEAQVRGGFGQGVVCEMKAKLFALSRSDQDLREMLFGSEAESVCVLQRISRWLQTESISEISCKSVLFLSLSEEENIEK